MVQWPPPSLMLQEAIERSINPHCMKVSIETLTQTRRKCGKIYKPKIATGNAGMSFCLVETVTSFQSKTSQVNVCRSNPFALPSDKPFLGEILEALKGVSVKLFSTDMIITTVSYCFLNANPKSIFSGWILYMYTVCSNHKN